MYNSEDHNRSLTRKKGSLGNHDNDNDDLKKQLVL